MDSKHKRDERPFDHPPALRQMCGDANKRDYGRCGGARRAEKFIDVERRRGNGGAMGLRRVKRYGDKRRSGTGGGSCRAKRLLPIGDKAIAEADNRLKKRRYN